MSHSIRIKSLAPSRPRVLTAAALLSGALVAGCVGSSGSQIATTAGGASTSESSAANSASTGASPGARGALAFAECMRANGVSNFPDPNAGGGGFDFHANAGVISSPAFKMAQAKCGKFLPGGGPLARGRLRRHRQWNSYGRSRCACELTASRSSPIPWPRSRTGSTRTQPNTGRSPTTWERSSCIPQRSIRRHQRTRMPRPPAAPVSSPVTTLTDATNVVTRERWFDSASARTSLTDAGPIRRSVARNGGTVPMLVARPDRRAHVCLLNPGNSHAPAACWKRGDRELIVSGTAMNTPGRPNTRL